MNKLSDVKIAQKLVRLYTSAKVRNKEFDLSFKRLKELLNTRTCYYTGVPLNRSNGHPHQLTLDRIDNTKGYIDSNVVACSKQFNEKKADITIDDIKLILKAFKKKKII